MKVHVGRHHKDALLPQPAPPYTESQGQQDRPCAPAWLDFAALGPYDDSFYFPPELDMDTLLMPPVTPARLAIPDRESPADKGPGITPPDERFIRPAQRQPCPLSFIPELGWRNGFQVSEAKREEMAAIVRETHQQVRTQWPRPFTISPRSNFQKKKKSRQPTEPYKYQRDLRSSAILLPFFISSLRFSPASTCRHGKRMRSNRHFSSA
jgi:hypothetical protein